jgi:hypothetical protein
MNLLEIILHEDLDMYPDITYKLNGEVISVVFCLADDQRKPMLKLCKALNCDIIQTVLKYDGTQESFSIILN